MFSNICTCISYMLAAITLAVQIEQLVGYVYV